MLTGLSLNSGLQGNHHFLLYSVFFQFYDNIYREIKNNNSIKLTGLYNWLDKGEKEKDNSKTTLRSLSLQICLQVAKNILERS